MTNFQINSIRRSPNKDLKTYQKFIKLSSPQEGKVTKKIVEAVRFPLKQGRGFEGKSQTNNHPLSVKILLLSAGVDQRRHTFETHPLSDLRGLTGAFEPLWDKSPMSGSLTFKGLHWLNNRFIQNMHFIKSASFSLSTQDFARPKSLLGDPLREQRFRGKRPHPQTKLKGTPVCVAVYHGLVNAPRRLSRMHLSSLAAQVFAGAKKRGALVRGTPLLEQTKPSNNRYSSLGALVVLPWLWSDKVCAKSNHWLLAQKQSITEQKQRGSDERKSHTFFISSMELWQTLALEYRPETRVLKLFKRRLSAVKTASCKKCLRVLKYKTTSQNSLINPAT